MTININYNKTIIIFKNLNSFLNKNSSRNNNNKDYNHNSSNNKDYNKIILYLKLTKKKNNKFKSKLT